MHTEKARVAGNSVEFGHLSVITHGDVGWASRDDLLVDLKAILREEQV